MFNRFILILIGCFSQLLLATSLTIKEKQSVQAIHCLSSDKKLAQRNYYALETPYPQISEHNNYNIEGCTPDKIWLQIRHGTRYPKTHSTKGMEKILPTIQDNIGLVNQLCQPDYALLTNWKINTSQPDCVLVRPQGWNDLHGLAQRFKNIYPTIFDTPYSPEVYKFVHSSAVRTKQSCMAFTETLFGRKIMEHSQQYWTTDNIILRPWTFCQPSYGSSSKREMDTFKESIYYKELISNVTRRLGMKSMLKPKQISMMWDECRYQQDFHLESFSPWCAAFTINEAIILEYLSDLNYYHKYSYGNDLASVLPCRLIKSMLETMTSSNTSIKVSANFGHAKTMLLLLTALGAKRDAKQLLASNFEQQQNRKFKLSELDPFAANFAAVKYKCSSCNSVARNSSYYTSHSSDSNGDCESKVLMLLNGKPIDMPWCNGGSICTVDEISRMFQRSGMCNCPYDICGHAFVHAKDYDANFC